MWISLANAQQVEHIGGKIKMSQCLLFEDEKKALGLDPSNMSNKDIKLINLCCSVKAGYKDLISSFVKNALDAGFSRDDLLKAIAVLIEGGPALDSIMEFLRALSYEENIRREPISLPGEYGED